MHDLVNLAYSSHTGRRNISDMSIIAKSCIYSRAEAVGAVV